LQNDFIRRKKEKRLKYTDLVNVFQGCGPIKPAPPEDIAASWHFIKGLSGNTFPGAMLPFGKLSAGCYSGGYPTGYGDNMINYGDPVRALYGEKRVIGVSHIHHDGTGDYEDFKRRLKVMMQGELHRNICYTPEEWWDPKGWPKFREASGYFVTMTRGTLE